MTRGMRMNGKFGKAWLVALLILVLAVGVAATSYPGNQSSFYLDYASRYPFSYMIEQRNSTYYQMVNGTTGKVDYQSTNATGVFIFAAANVSAMGGGVIFVRAGTYNMTDDATFNPILLGNNTRITGEGNSSLIIGHNTMSSYGATFENQNFGTPNEDQNIEIDHLAFDGSNYTQTNNVACDIYMQGINGLKIHDNFFYNTRGHDILLQAVAGVDRGDNMNIEVYNNYADWAAYNFVGFFSTHATNQIRNVNIYNNYVTNTDTAISVGGHVTNFIIANNIVEYNLNTLLFHNGFGIGIEEIGGTAIDPDNGTVTGNIVRGNVAGIKTVTGSSRPANLDISNNVLMGNGHDATGGYVVNYGVEIYLDANGSKIHGNQITPTSLSGQWGFYVTGYGNSVTDNIEYGTPGSGIPFGLYGTGHLIEGNKIYNAATYGIYGSADNSTIRGNMISRADSTSGTGINLLNGAFGNYIVDNTFMNMTTGLSLAVGSLGNIIERNMFDKVTIPINDLGTNTFIRWNYGYKTEASGNATIADGQTTVTVTHGMVSTPTFVLITPTNSTITIIPVVSSKGATTFVITGGSGSGVYYWYAQTWSYP